MEWVEVTARTVDEAKNLALDQLGVDTDDAEFEILEEPRPGLFGRTRGQARVRARIRPTRPRAKVERRDRRRPGGKKRSDRPASDAADTADTADAAESAPIGETAEVVAETTVAGAEPASKRPQRRRTTPNSPKPTPQGDPAMTETAPDADVDLETHTAIVSEFLSGLVEAFGLEGTIEVESVDEDTNEIRVQGSDLGLLVGPKGNTLAAVQELSRTVVHRRVPGHAAGRIRLDVGGYRQRRREALERFTQSIAEEVRTSGVQKALEPMSPADRKVVHDTVNEIDGVSTISEGEDSRRRVVIIPA
jgi:spoIIIJ-associated protein